MNNHCPNITTYHLEDICDYDLMNIEPPYILNKFSNFEIFGVGHCHYSQSAAGLGHYHLINVKFGIFPTYYNYYTFLPVNKNVVPHYIW